MTDSKLDSDSNDTTSHDSSAVCNIQTRLLIFDRSGKGNVHFLRIKDDSLELQSADIYSEVWPQLNGLRDFGVCCHGNWIYVIGGYDVTNKQHSDSLKRYNIMTDIWEDLPSMFISRCSFSVIVASNKIYVTGGERNTGKPTRSCEAFDLGTMAWERVGLLPAARKHHACATDGTRVLVSGGENINNVKQRNVWLSEDFTWNDTDDDYPTTMATGISHHCMEMYDNTIYFFAGIEKPDTNHIPSSTPAVEDTANPTNHKGRSKDARELSKNPEDCQSLKCQKHKVHPPKHRRGAQERYPVKGSKILKSESTKPVNNKNSKKNVHKVTQSDARSKHLSNEKAQRKDAVLARSVHSRHAEEMEAFMPFVTSQVTDDTWFVSPWQRTLGCLRHLRYSAASIILGNRMYVIGGTGKNSKTVRMVEFYDFNRKTWNNAFKLPEEVEAKSVSCVVVTCPSDRRQRLFTQQFVDKWSNYRWIMW